MTTTRIALAAVLLIGTASAAFAEDGLRRAKRAPAHANGVASQSTPVRINQSPDMSMPGANLMMNVMDRASSPFACGG